MRREDLTREFVLSWLRYDAETGEFIWIKSGKTAGTLDHGYVYIRLKQIKLLAHRLAWLLMTGTHPESEIDHINQCKSDNRWANLRRVLHHQNSWNAPRHRDGSSRYKGVSWNSDCSKWAVNLMSRGKRKYVGIFSSEEEAARAYDETARQEHGEHASLNFPERSRL